MKNNLLYMFLILHLVSCHQEENATIDDELMSYIETFEEEAALRGMEINVLGLNVSAHIMDIEENGVLGQCLSFTDHSKEIAIDQVYWQTLDEMDREYLMMHELGHCVLDRDHYNEEDQSGNCESIMQSGNGNCRKRYNANNRTRMLNELFNI